MKFKLLKKFFVTTLFLISIISTVANAEVIDNDTNLGAPYGNYNDGFDYLPRGLNGDSRIYTNGDPDNHHYEWYKLEYHWGVRYVGAYLDDLAFTDTAAHYSISYHWYGTYLMGTSLGDIDQCNAPSGYNMCPTQNVVINGYMSIWCVHRNGQTGADAISLDYFE